MTKHFHAPGITCVRCEEGTDDQSKLQKKARDPREVKPKEIVGKTIEAIEFIRFKDGRGGWATEPVIVLSDGSALDFHVQETDVGQYGIVVSRDARKHIEGPEEPKK